VLLSRRPTPSRLLGDKSKAQLSCALPKNLAITFNQTGRDIPTFADTAAVTDLIFKSGTKYDSIVIVYNKLVSLIPRTMLHTMAATLQPFPLGSMHPTTLPMHLLIDVTKHKLRQATSLVDGAIRPTTRNRSGTIKKTDHRKERDLNYYAVGYTYA